MVCRRTLAADLCRTFSCRCKVISMSERPEEPNKASDAESLLPIDEHVEEGHDAEGRQVRHRGIYLLPNLFTTANLFAGFYSIISSMSAQSAMSAGDSAGA
ncbi:CDP-diacylglycerol--serine O-phosphatidyltransferase, partial [Pseudomonas syringae pv. delphinii]